MRQMKDSGTQGIGLIPQSWDSKQLGVFFSENRKANSYLESVTALQFKYGEIIQKPNNGRDLSDKDKELLSKYTVINPGDVVVNGLNLNFDLKSLRIAIARENGIITSAYIVLRPRKGVNPEYYNYLLKALDFQKILHGMGEGIRLTLSYDELKKLNVPAPDAAIQTAIVSYLDTKCGEIDSLIALQEQMIEKLKAYKQSVITEAVTKGLDPNAKLVPSGIDWIGEIPEGWQNIRLKDIFILKTGTTPKSFEEGLNEDDSLVNWFTPSDVSEQNCILTQSDRHLNRKVVEKEGIKLYPVGSLIFVGIGASAGKIGYAAVEGYSNQQITALIPRKGQMYSKYFYYYMLADSRRIRDNAFFTTLPIINNGYLSGISILNPPLFEQHSIAAYLDEKCADIDRLIFLKQQKIESLKEYKKSVIYEAVTGKTEIV